jgi:hypothetical protein
LKVAGFPLVLVLVLPIPGTGIFTAETPRHKDRKCTRGKPATMNLIVYI